MYNVCVYNFLLSLRNVNVVNFLCIFYAISWLGASVKKVVIKNGLTLARISTRVGRRSRHRGERQTWMRCGFAYGECPRQSGHRWVLKKNF